jgi:hypothetical protein
MKVIISTYPISPSVPDSEYAVAFTIGAQTFELNMGSDGSRPKNEALWYMTTLRTAFLNLGSEVKTIERESRFEDSDEEETKT